MRSSLGPKAQRNLLSPFPLAIVNTLTATTQAPRSPTAEELQQLAGYLASTGYEPEDAIAIARDAYVAVYDRYVTGGPGYVGKLMSVVWDGSPSFFDVFTWSNGAMERCGRDYDERECYRCGAKHGTLCVNCWREWSRKTGI